MSDFDLRRETEKVLRLARVDEIIADIKSKQPVAPRIQKSDKNADELYEQIKARYGRKDGAHGRD
jgi:hypothetical protein